MLGDEIFSRAIGLYDRLDQVLRNIAVVGKELLGVLG